MEYLINNIVISFLLINNLVVGLVPVKTDADSLVGAAGANNLKGLNYWVAIHKINPNILNSFGRSALGMAAGMGQLDAVNWLLTKGADPNIQDKNGLTPLAWASITPNLKRPGKDRGNTEQDYINIINALLMKGARTDILDQNGLSPLHGAARSGNVAIIKLLLDKGAKPLINQESAQDKGRTPLFETIRASKDAIIHVDLENKNITDQLEFEKALDEALVQLKNKERKTFNQSDHPSN